MRKEDIEYYLREKLIRLRTPDSSTIKTLIESAGEKAKAAKMLQVDENTATLIFLGLYESMRQLGDAKWWQISYEALSHEPSMRILQESNITEKTKLAKLDMFRRIRNDSNYRGQKITVAEAKEILEVWESCSHEIIEELKKK